MIDDIKQSIMKGWFNLFMNQKAETSTASTNHSNSTKTVNAIKSLPSPSTMHNNCPQTSDNPSISSTNSYLPLSISRPAFSNDNLIPNQNQSTQNHFQPQPMALGAQIYHQLPSTSSADTLPLSAEGRRSQTATMTASAMPQFNYRHNLPEAHKQFHSKAIRNFDRQREQNKMLVFTILLITNLMIVVCLLLVWNVKGVTNENVKLAIAALCATTAFSMFCCFVYSFIYFDGLQQNYCCFPSANNNKKPNAQSRKPNKQSGKMFSSFPLFSWKNRNHAKIYSVQTVFPTPEFQYFSNPSTHKKVETSQLNRMISSSKDSQLSGAAFSIASTAPATSMLNITNDNFIVNSPNSIHQMHNTSSNSAYATIVANTEQLSTDTIPQFSTGMPQPFITNSASFPSPPLNQYSANFIAPPISPQSSLPPPPLFQSTLQRQTSPPFANTSPIPSYLNNSFEEMNQENSIHSGLQPTSLRHNETESRELFESRQTCPVNMYSEQ